MDLRHCRQSSPDIWPRSGPHIPAPPPRMRHSSRRITTLSAINEASLVGSLALAVSWGLAELALLLG